MDLQPFLDALLTVAIVFVALLVAFFLAAEWTLKRSPVPPLANPLELAGALPYRVLLFLDLLDALWVPGAAVSWWFLTRHGLVALRGIVVIVDIIPGTGLLPLFTLAGWLARKLGLGYRYRARLSTPRRQDPTALDPPE